MSVKRYYWLKLPKDFFTDVVIKKLKKKERGYVYIVIYTELLLLSLEDEGYLFFETVEDNFNEELALRIDEDPTDIKTTIEYLIDKRLLEVKADDEYFLNRMPEMIGSESDSAKRMRRKRKKDEKASQCDTDVTKCDTDVTKCDTDVTKCDTDVTKCDTEIEIDKIREDKKIDDIDRFRDRFKEVTGRYAYIKNQSSINSFIDSYGATALDVVMEQIEHSNYLKSNADFEWVCNNLINIANGKYRDRKEEYEADFECWPSITDKEILL